MWKIKISVNLQITLSKILAFAFLACAMVLDIKSGTGATAFMFTLPFSTALILGKQIVDRNKPTAE